MVRSATQWCIIEVSNSVRVRVRSCCFVLAAWKFYWKFIIEKMPPPHLIRQFSSTSVCLKMRPDLGKHKDKFLFKEILPLKLRNRVTGKGSTMSNVACVHEITLLFNCFKLNDFNESKCAPEIERMQKCFTENRIEKRQKAELDKVGDLAPGSSRLSTKQLNKLLRHHPDLS